MSSVQARALAGVEAARCTAARAEAVSAPPNSLDLTQLRSVAQLASGIADTAVNIGWITHDARGVAGDSAKIASSVEELSHTTAEISQSSVTMADQSERVRLEAEACRHEVTGAGEAMERVNDHVGAMHERLAILEAAVGQITDMAKTIEAISKQTNLLALNATIEAARAGEAGRGFAVVAGEVKSLSSQTAQATDQIRTRIATLTDEMAAIKREIATSAETVAAGKKAVEATELRIAGIGEQMVGMNVRMKALVDLLGQQSAATETIAQRVNRIAGKAKKTGDEVQASLERLVKAESHALAAIDVPRAADRADYELMRAKADLAVWKRQLAATLVGLAKPEARLADETLRLARWCERDGGSLRGLPAFAALRVGFAKTRTEASRFVKAAAASDWRSATDAYVATEKTIDEINGHIDALTAAMSS